MDPDQPGAPGVLAIEIDCPECSTKFAVSRYVGEPLPAEGTYKLEGNCPKCGKVVSFTAIVEPIDGE